MHKCFTLSTIFYLAKAYLYIKELFKGVVKIISGARPNSHPFLFTTAGPETSYLVPFY